eukprot:4611291-Amphidinium_carterae.3
MTALPLLQQTSDIIDQWRAAVAGGNQEQLDQAEKVLRSPWVAVVQDLLAPSSALRGNTETAREWTEVLVLAIIWADPPGVPPSEVLVALPSHIGVDLADEAYHGVSVYPPEESGDEGEEQPGEVVQISLHRIPADRLRVLAESTPVSESVVPFSGLLAGWLPDPAACFLSWDQSELSQGVAIHLGGAERAGECLLSLTCGTGPLDEVYASAAEIEPGEACLALVKSIHPSTAAPGTPVGSLLGGLGKSAPSRGQALRGLSPMPSTRQSSYRKRGESSAREGGTTPPPAGRGSAKARAKPAAKKKVMPAEETLSGPLQQITHLVEGLHARLERLESAPASRESQAPGGPPAAPAGTAQSASHPGAASVMPSLLARGRIPPPGVPGAHQQAPAAGSRAYAGAMAEARGLLGDHGNSSGWPPPNPEQAPPLGRERQVEQSLKGVVEAGGDINMAVQLAILQQLERMGEKGDKEKTQPKTLEDILYGAPGLVESDATGASSSGGLTTKGSQTLLRLQRSQEQYPAAWANLTDERAIRELGSDQTGMPWSMQTYGQQRLVFPARHEHLHRMWTMLCHLHTLSRMGKHQEVDLAITQFLKSIEQATMANGSWKIAWSLTGLPDPVEKSTAGLTHPQELSAAIQHVKEQRTMEDLLRKAGGNLGWPGQQNDSGAGGQKKPKGKGDQKGAVPPPTQT